MRGDKRIMRWVNPSCIRDRTGVKLYGKYVKSLEGGYRGGIRVHALYVGIKERESEKGI